MANNRSKKLKGTPAVLAGVSFMERKEGECAAPLWSNQERPGVKGRYCGKPCGETVNSQTGRKRFSAYCSACAAKLYHKAPRLSENLARL